MNKELIKELALECIRTDKNEALKIVLGIDINEEKDAEIKIEQAPVEIISVDANVEPTTANKRKITKAEEYIPVHKAETIKKKGCQLGVRVGGKLTAYYDENNLKLDVNGYKESFLSKKETATLLYLFDKYKNVFEIAKRTGLAVSSVARYANMLKAEKLMDTQGDNGWVINNSLLYLNR